MTSTTVSPLLGRDGPTDVDRVARPIDSKEWSVRWWGVRLSRNRDEALDQRFPGFESEPLSDETAGIVHRELGRPLGRGKPGGEPLLHLRGVPVPHECSAELPVDLADRGEIARRVGRREPP